MSIRDRGKGARPLPRDNQDSQYFRSDAVCCIAPVVYRDLVSGFSPAMFSSRMLTACCGRKKHTEEINPVCALAVGLKPSATECKARLRGLYRIIYSKTIVFESDAYRLLRQEEAY